jgi:hypothetical protein
VDPNGSGVSDWKYPKSGDGGGIGGTGRACDWLEVSMIHECIEMGAKKATA